VTTAVDPYLDTLTTETLLRALLRDGEDIGQSVGSALRRMTYHYWYHIGEIQAIRQILGHANLPEYVGEIEEEAPYRPELQ
jgi:alpha-D-ribose 1-methylphosphonate 5-phosphate C-P lyase